jgi:hypothetical protein
MKTISPRFRIRLGSAAVVVLLLLGSGCGSKGSVSGKVFYRDKPLTGGLVQFNHPQLGVLSSPIAADGSYQIAKIPPAEVKIAVTGPPPEKPRSLPKNANMDWERIKASHPPGMSEEAIKRKMGIQPSPSSPSADAASSIPKKYSDPLQSGLTYTVTSGAQTYDIKLD